jgi:hypothetical protein
LILNSTLLGDNQSAENCPISQASETILSTSRHKYNTGMQNEVMDAYHKSTGTQEQAAAEVQIENSGTAGMPAETRRLHDRKNYDTEEAELGSQEDCQSQAI